MRRRCAPSAVLPDLESAWDRQAEWYDRMFDEENGDAHALRSRFDAVVRLVGAGPGALLDGGMGPGRLCAELARRGWTVSGVDVSPEMVSLARARVPDAAPRLLEGSIESLPFGDASFDCVTVTGVLEYTNVPAAIAEVARVLRPAGRAVVSYPNGRAAYHLWKSVLYYPAVRTVRRVIRRPSQRLLRSAPSQTPQRIEAIFREAGLTPSLREYTSAQPLLAPLDTAFPRAAARLGRRAEGLVHCRSLLTTQVVFLATKLAD